MPRTGAVTPSCCCDARQLRSRAHRRQRGRLGGDEFGCLLTDAPGRERIVHLAKALIDTVSAPFQVGELRLWVRPGIGIAMGPADGATAEEVIGHADAAMYEAKRERMGFAFFDQSVAFPWEPGLQRVPPAMS